MRVLISISETKGIISFIKNLKDFYSEIEIIATSGTNKYLKNNDRLEIVQFIGGG